MSKKSTTSSKIIKSLAKDDIKEKLIKKNKTSKTLNDVSINFKTEIDHNDHQIEKENLSLQVINQINTLKNKQDFCELFLQKIQIIENFFNDKLNELNIEFEKLQKKMQDKKCNMQANNSTPIKETDNFDKTFRDNLIKENAERDELGYAVSWKRALSSLYNLVSWLHSYSVINSIANQKILKKCNKVLAKQGVDNASEEIREETKVLSIFREDKKVVELRKKIKLFYSEQLTNNDVKKAKKELEARMKGNRVKDTAMISFYLGIILTLLFSLVLVSQIEIGVSENNSISYFFPAFSFSLILIFLMVGVGVNVIVFRKFRINYIYIFEIEPKSRLGHNEIFKTALFLLTIWSILLLLMKLSLSFNLFSGKFFVFPIILLSFITLFILWPFHCFYYNFRKGVIISTIKNIFPIGKNGVRFRDFMFGDILTSMTRPFASLVVSLCLLNCQPCIEMNRTEDCSRNMIAAFILMLLPFVIRFFQCLNRFYYTKMAWPHLGNALKYCGGMANVILSWLYAINKDDYFFFYLPTAVLATSYMLFWDIYMDWNLGRFDSKNFFLRDKIVYPKWMYYSAIVINSILRLTWIISFPAIGGLLPMGEETKVLILSLFEVYRRTQWSLFRVENENTNNPEKYRTILDIPELPIN